MNIITFMNVKKIHNFTIQSNYFCIYLLNEQNLKWILTSKNENPFTTFAT